MANDVCDALVCFVRGRTYNAQSAQCLLQSPGVKTNMANCWSSPLDLSIERIYALHDRFQRQPFLHQRSKRRANPPLRAAFCPPNLAHLTYNDDTRSRRTRRPSYQFWRLLDGSFSFGNNRKQLVGRNTETTHSPRTKFHPSFNEP